jgi:RNA polymerase sigma factor (sigma-70 family)
MRQIIYLTGYRAVAEELAQETFFKLYAAPPQELANPGVWLAKVAIHLGYKYLRGEKRRKYREEYVGVRELPNVVAIDDIGIRNQEIRLVRQVLRSLPGRDRMLLLLKFSGYRYDEIAPAIGVEKTSVGTLLARAQARFRQEYIRLNGGEPGVDG